MPEQAGQIRSGAQPSGARHETAASGPLAERLNARARTRLGPIAQLLNDASRPALAGTVIQRAKQKWDGAQWVSDGTPAGAHAVKPAGDFVDQIFDDVTGHYSQPAAGLGGYTSVSKSSAHHDLALIKSKAASAAAKKYGFSFVDKATEATDVATINAYINHLLKADPAPATAVAHGPATHVGAKPGMVQFTLNNRTYSTHADSPQLFPVSGQGIVSGLGPDQMLAELKRLGKLKDNDAKTYYAIKARADLGADDDDEEEGGGGVKPWAQLGKSVKKQYEQEFRAFLK